jgi:hypothetical protein
MNECCVKIGLWEVGFEKSRSREKPIADLEVGFWSYAYDTRPYAYEMAWRGGDWC